MASTIDANLTYAIQGQTLQDICDSVTKATGAEAIPVPKIPKMIDGINLKYEDIKDVMFMDYNGDLLYSWDKNDFIQNVNELPAGPTWHENLTFQEWNWTLADIKDELTKSGACCIGACYNTKDSLSHFYLDITDPKDLNITIYVARLPSATVVINWGDETSNTYTGNTSAIHTYSALGKYHLIISGGFVLTSSCYFMRRYPGANDFTGGWYVSNNNFLTRVELGSNAKLYVQNAAALFPDCPNLVSVSVHKDLIYDTTITNTNLNAAFRADTSLRFFVFPKSFGELPLSSLGYVLLDAFNTASSLISVSFPKGSLVCKCNIFQDSGIRFLYVPYQQTVTATQSTSYYPTFVRMPRLIRLAWAFGSASISASNKWYQTFMYDASLKKLSLETMNMAPPNRYTCYGCYNLEGEITLPSTWTALTGENFYNCYNVTKYTFLGDVTAVGVANGNVFANNYSCLEWDFTHCTSVPTLYNTNCFNNIRTTAKIKVPAALETAWKAATNWSTYASYIVGV